jgi:uncharacterized membrane protein
MKTGINVAYAMIMAIVLILGTLYGELPLNGFTLLAAAGMLLAFWNARKWSKFDN